MIGQMQGVSIANKPPKNPFKKIIHQGWLEGFMSVSPKAFSSEITGCQYSGKIKTSPFSSRISCLDPNEKKTYTLALDDFIAKGLHTDNGYLQRLPIRKQIAFYGFYISVYVIFFLFSFYFLYKNRFTIKPT